MTTKIVASLPPVLLDRFRGEILRHGAAAAQTVQTRLSIDPDGRMEVFYVQKGR